MSQKRPPMTQNRPAAVATEASLLRDRRSRTLAGSPGNRGWVSTIHRVQSHASRRIGCLLAHPTRTGCVGLCGLLGGDYGSRLGAVFDRYRPRTPGRRLRRRLPAGPTNPPVIALMPGTVAFVVQQGGASPAPQQIAVTNFVTGPLTGLAVGQIAYGSGGSAWLHATIDKTIAPATPTLDAAGWPRAPRGCAPTGRHCAPPGGAARVGPRCRSRSGRRPGCGTEPARGTRSGGRR